jgi:hypothetical protein
MLYRQKNNGCVFFIWNQKTVNYQGYCKRESILLPPPHP